MTGPRGEAARKSIHLLASLIAAAVVWRLPPEQAAIVLASATAVALSVEAARLALPAVARAFERRLGGMLRAPERRGITGATTLSIGYTLAAVLLPGLPALAGILFTGVADAGAAAVGRRWGRHRYRGGKSLEGSATFFVLAVGLGLALGMGPLAALITVAVATAAEAVTLRVHDNLYLPTVVALLFRLFGGVSA